MHRSGWIVGVVALLFASAPRCRAQDTTRSWSLGADNESGVYIGLQRSAGFRLEGELGLLRRRDEGSYYYDIGTGTPSVVETIKTSSYRVGVGLLWQRADAARLRVYWGPRIGMILLRSEDVATGSLSGSSKATRTDWFIAGSIGAEYFPIDRLSAGADVQLRGVLQGSATHHDTGSGTSGAFLPADPTLATRGLLMLRFYL